MRVKVATAYVAGAFSVFLAGVAVADNAAHEIADRFSQSEETQGKNDAEREAYEADMLERARREAAERADEAHRAAAEQQRHQRELEAEREREARVLADRLKRADEERRAAQTVEAPFKPALTHSDKAATKPEDKLTGKAIVVAPPAEVADEPPVQVPSPAMVTRAPDAEGKPPVTQIPAPAVTQPADLPETLVTILLVMEPGKKGIRRFNRVADPVICEGARCFVSNGAGAPARVMTKSRTLGPGNTFGQRAGACRGKLVCVFRGLTLDRQDPVLQPVDLKVLVHDRREPRAVSADASCRVLVGRLTCGRTIVAKGYRAWVVPEGVAQEAGPTALEAAAQRGLVSEPLREAALTP